ncbi:MAG: N-acetylmuramoyl-L-alanine amidase [Chitinophagaceae bacterium]|nr:N-acetylmuramoyl-L-alanine amidase [Chitinophagaceae bacterium]
MNQLFTYLLQVILSSGLLYGYYHLFLRNKEFHQYNRFYLLFATVLSLCIPFLNIPVYFTEAPEQSSVMFKTLLALSGSEWDAAALTTDAVQPAYTFDWYWLIKTFYTTIVVVLLIRFLSSIIKIGRLISKHKVEKLDRIRFMSTEEPGTPFSFFSWLFWDKDIDLHTAKGEQIFRHEVYHIQQRHSWDVMLMEVVRTICWINPFFHLMKKELRIIHEFLADRFAVDEESKWEYAELLLMQALDSQQRLVTPFFHNQIKRRIAMITNPQKTSHRYLRKLLVLPLGALVLTLFAFKYKNSAVDAARWGEPLTVVIDAGHGGTDPGSYSPDKKFTEAELSLAIARKVEQLAGAYNIKVVMTRSNEQFPNNAGSKDDGNRQRLLISQANNPDAYVSIHLNTSTGSAFQQSNAGAEAYIASRRTDKSGQLLAASLLESIATVHKVSSAVKMRTGSSIYVLDENTVPAVILECGYINNKQDLAFCSDEKTQEKLAHQILQGLRNFHNMRALVEPQSENKSVILADTVPVREQVKEVKLVATNAAPVQKKETITLKFATQSPLVVIDNVVQEREIRLDSLNPEQIKSITVLKGESAERQYGIQGRGGVLEIRTKALREVKIENLIGRVKEVNFQTLEKIKAEDVEIKKIIVDGYVVSSDQPKKVAIEGIAVEETKPIELKLAATKKVLGEVTVTARSKPAVAEKIAGLQSVTVEQPVEESKKEKIVLDEVVVVGFAKKAEVLSAPKKETLPATSTLPVIYPNPASSNVTMQLPADNQASDVQIRLMDMSGRAFGVYQKVNVQKGSNTVSLDVSSLKTGQYIIQVTGVGLQKAQAYKLIKN